MSAQQPTTPITPGQRQGLDQLLLVAERSGDALRVEPLGTRNGFLEVRLHLSCEDVARAPGGVELEPVEQVDVLIHPDFPFVPPRPEFPHDRFAEAAHVQWGSLLCLYVAPSIEWSPGDGMFGFLDRLVEWYERAAANRINAPGAPLHPPPAYTSADAGCVVIHANAPPTGDGDPPWRGAAVLRRFGSQRADVTGWLPLGSPDELTERALADRLRSFIDSGQERHGRGGQSPLPPAALALAVIGPPSGNGPAHHDPIAALKARGLGGEEAADLFWLIHDASRLANGRPPVRTPADRQAALAKEPLYIVIGTPGHGREGEDERVTHLTAWRLLSETDAGWARVYERRPEVIERRDGRSPATWLQGKRVLLLGCGALGAPIAEQCIRAGVAELVLVDSGAVNPGVLVRQPYGDADVGRSKAKALQERLVGIELGVEVRSLDRNALVHDLGDDQGPPTGYHLVVDATANAAVAARLEHRRASARGDWPAVASFVIGHEAQRGVATLSFAGASGGGADILRRLGLEGRLDAATGLGDVVRDLFPDPPRNDLFQPEPGCSEATFEGSAAEVTALASHLFTGVLARLKGGPEKGRPAGPMSAYVVRLGCDLDSEPLAPARLAWPDDHVVLDRAFGYEVRIDARALADMRRECRQVAAEDERRHGAGEGDRPYETGGMLLGQIDDACKVVWVSVAPPPPPDSQRYPDEFVHGVDGVEELIDRYEEASARTVGFVGMWHTHPGGLAAPSPKDLGGMAKLLKPAGRAPRRAVLMILGGCVGQWSPDSRRRWSAWLGGSEAPAVYAELVNRPRDEAGS